MKTVRALHIIAAMLLMSLLATVPAEGSGENLPVYLQDRETGVSSSLFGTYINKGELLVYPFFEYYKNSDEEYAPDELGAVGAEDFRGDYEAVEGILFIGYGFTDDFAVEIEAGIIDAKLKTDPNDPSGVPAEVSESGVSDVEGQLRWRLLRETESRPELFSFLEVVFPVQDNKQIIGTPDWEFKLGGALVKGFSWGTITGRASVAYNGEESKTEFGEYAVEYLKKVTSAVKVFFAVEGEEDEIEAIPEVLWTFHEGYPRMTLVLNSAFGLTSKAQDWAPEVGVQLLF